MIKEYFDKSKAWIMEKPMNKIIAGVAGVAILFFLYKKFARKTTRRRRRYSRPIARRVTRRATRRRSSKGKPAWMVKGSLAARRRMAQIRRKKSKKLF